jgi:leader peptidase (prepilin peptidase)/N-methyltransferase
VALIVGVFGSFIGSFLNVVAYRVPLKRSIVSPPSACTECAIPIKAYDNIPIISWFLLRGRCRNCKSPISLRYPIVELGTGIFFAIVVVKFLPAAESGVSLVAQTGRAIFSINAHSLVLLIALLYLAGLSVVLALIDADTQILPNRIVFPSYFVAATLLGVAGVLSQDYVSILRAAFGMAILWVAYMAVALISNGGIGFGDVKLAGLIGLYLGYSGWGALITGTFAAFALGGIFGLVLIVSRRANRKSGIPFGPWMLAGAWVALFFSATLVHEYLTLFGLNAHA